MGDEAAFIWDLPSPEPRRRPVGSTDDAGRGPSGERITLREASRRFGVAVGTLRGWCRNGKVDARLGDGPHGRQWMVDASSIARHLSGRTSRSDPPPAPEPTGPTADGSAMLVPRDAWDKLMDQLGNLHEAGQQLAEARERAVKAETEVSFLRERLAEMRDAPRPAASSDQPRPGWIRRVFGR